MHSIRIYQQFQPASENGAFSITSISPRWLAQNVYEPLYCSQKLLPFNAQGILFESIKEHKNWCCPNGSIEDVSQALKTLHKQKDRLFDFVLKTLVECK